MGIYQYKFVLFILYLEVELLLYFEIVLHVLLIIIFNVFIIVFWIAIEFELLLMEKINAN